MLPLLSAGEWIEAFYEYVVLSCFELPGMLRSRPRASFPAISDVVVGPLGICSYILDRILISSVMKGQTMVLKRRCRPGERQLVHEPVRALSFLSLRSVSSEARRRRSFTTCRSIDWFVLVHIRFLTGTAGCHSQSMAVAIGR